MENKRWRQIREAMYSPKLGLWVAIGVVTFALVVMWARGTTDNAESRQARRSQAIDMSTPPVDVHGSSFGFEYLPRIESAWLAIQRRGQVLNMDHMSREEYRLRWVSTYPVWESRDLRIVEKTRGDGTPHLWIVQRRRPETGEWYGEGPEVFWDSSGNRSEGVRKGGEPVGDYRLYSPIGELLQTETFDERGVLIATH